MLTLPPKLTASFKEAWLEAFGREIADEDAQRYGRELLDTMGLLLRIRAKAIKERRGEKELGEPSRGQ